MRVRFEVTGSTHDELIEAAKKQVEAFAPGQKYELRIETEAAVRDVEGHVTLWVGDVVALTDGSPR